MSKVRFCFTLPFLACSATVIFLACGIAIANWEEFTHALRGLVRVRTLFWVWLTILFVGTAHECAHGLTCKYFGGQVHELGFLLLQFQPAFYCDVSDAWLLPARSQRLWVTFAGPYLELFLAALATFAWRVTDPDTWLYPTALVVMATSGIKTFFNFNPLSKLDGYYMLSDYLGIPNLRARAFGYLGAGAKRLWGRAGEGTTAVTHREQWIYLSYGLLAGAYSLLLLGYVALKSGALLVKHYQGLGFILSGVLILARVRKGLRKAFLNLRARVTPRLAALGALGRPATVPIGLAAVLVALFLVRMELKVWGEFRILPLHDTDVRLEIEGTVTEIHVKEGDQVQKGDLIARLSGRDHTLLNVVSPAPGTITTPTRQLQEMIGQHVTKGGLIAQVDELRSVVAEISVSEKEIADVAVGQRVALRARAYPARTFEGTVTSIGATATENAEGGAGSRILVVTQLDNGGRLLKPGMTGNAKIFCGERRVLDLMTRRLARYLRVEFWSWW